MEMQFKKKAEKQKDDDGLVDTSMKKVKLG